MLLGAVSMPINMIFVQLHVIESGLPNNTKTVTGGFCANLFQTHPLFLFADNVKVVFPQSHPCAHIPILRVFSAIFTNVMNI